MINFKLLKNIDRSSLRSLRILQLPEGRMFVEDFTVEMYADISLHVLGTIIQHLVGVEALRHGPSTHDVVHHPLAECFRYLVEFHELPDVIQHVVVFRSRRCHLLDDRRNVTKDCGVK